MLQVVNVIKTWSGGGTDVNDPETQRPWGAGAL